MSEVATEKHYQVEHTTRYDYAEPVVHAHHLLHLTPRQHAWQHTMRYQLELLPLVGLLHEAKDAFGNTVHRLEIEGAHECLAVTARSEVVVQSRPVWSAANSLMWERLQDELSYFGRPRTATELEALSFRTESPHGRIKNVFAEFARGCFPRACPVLQGAERLMEKIYTEMTYAPGETQVNTSSFAVLEKRRGVCQDFAHLMIACLRSLGLSARYVSGYLRTQPPEGSPPLVGADASHAWVSVYAPPFGWVDLDPTNNVRVGTDHITLAWGRDFSDVSPLRGVIIGGGSHRVSVAVTVSECPSPVLNAEAASNG